MSLEVLAREGEEVSDIHAVLNQQLQTQMLYCLILMKAFQIGYTTRRDGAFGKILEWFEDQDLKAKQWLFFLQHQMQQKPIQKFLTYQVSRRDDILFLDPFIVERDGQALWPSFDINSEMAEARGYRELNNQAMERSRLENEAVTPLLMMKLKELDCKILMKKQTL